MEVIMSNVKHIIENGDFGNPEGKQKIKFHVNLGDKVLFTYEFLFDLKEVEGKIFEIAQNFCYISYQHKIVRVDWENVRSIIKK
jgi:hypothetical protein